MENKKITRRKLLRMLITAVPLFPLGCSALFKEMIAPTDYLTPNKNLSYDEFVPKIEFPRKATSRERTKKYRKISR